MYDVMPKIVKIEEAMQAKKLGLSLKEYRNGITQARLLTEELLSHVMKGKST